MKKQVITFIKTNYKSFTLEQCATRPGSLDILKQPSRMGNKLYYPDGRVEDDVRHTISKTTSD